MMNHSFGPWTTSLGSSARLSTFWKRRMTMLPVVSRCQSAYSWNRISGLLLTAFVLTAIPTLRERPMSADAPDTPRMSGRIYVDVAFQQDRKVETMLIAIDPETGDWKKMCDGPGSLVRVSPDGQTVVFSRPRDGIWNCDTKGGNNPARIFDKDGMAIWSPDSKEIIVQHMVGGIVRRQEGDTTVEEVDAENLKYEFWRMDAAGTNPVRLAIPESHMVSDWSPDGNWLITTTFRESHMDLMRPDGSERRRLASAGGNPRFSHDGKKIVYSRGKGVWVVDIEGRSSREIFSQGEERAAYQLPCWSPDGKYVAVRKWSLPNNGVKPFSIDSGKLEIIDVVTRERREVKLTGDPEILWIGHPDWR